jgi:signal transduction histidine kinase
VNRTILTTEIRSEQDVVGARQRTKQIAASLGLDVQDQTRMATAVSEIARNAYRYAGGGRVEFAVDQAPAAVFKVRVSDAGPGVKDLQSVLDGTYHSETGMGLGIAGSRRLVDRFEISSQPGNTTVVLGKALPPEGPRLTTELINAITNDLVTHPPGSSLDQVQQQNQELLQTLEALRNRQAEVERLNEELAETNRGVLALYAELDDKAQELKKVSDQKSRFLSNITHELRTPLNSIIMLSRMMLSQKDGPLGEEYKKQAGFIVESSESLLELVNDLLDLAKIEAGKVDVRPSTFSVEEMLASLRGMFRPLLAGKDVDLVIEPVDPELMIYTDAAKVSQIVRNLLSNAVKFTEKGEIRVKAEYREESVAVSVSDTGPGISPEGQRRLFQDFAQLKDEYRKGIKGTGLGLSISRQLAELLGGRITLESEVGKGSTFTATLPVHYGAQGEGERGAGVGSTGVSEMELNRA